LLLSLSIAACAVSAPDAPVFQSSESFVAIDANRNVVARGSSVRYR
jgi:hypothetical protein